MPGKIRCEVHNCHYNEHGFCEAENIEARPKRSRTAESSLGKYCETFIPGDEMDPHIDDY